MFLRWKISYRDLVVAILFFFLKMAREIIFSIGSARGRPVVILGARNCSFFEKKLTTFRILLYNGIETFTVVVGSLSWGYQPFLFYHFFSDFKSFVIQRN